MAGWDIDIPKDYAYDWASFTIPSGTTDYDLKANQSALFKNIPNSRGIVVVLDQTIGIKLNSTSMPMITVTAAQQPFEFLNKKIIQNAYITNNSGSTVNLQVLLV